MSELEELVNDENKVKKYKSEAADFICTKYSWDDVVEKTLRIYR